MDNSIAFQTRILVFPVEYMVGKMALKRYGSSRIVNCPGFKLHHMAIFRAEPAFSMFSRIRSVTPKDEEKIFKVWKNKRNLAMFKKPVLYLSVKNVTKN